MQRLIGQLLCARDGVSQQCRLVQYSSPVVQSNKQKHPCRQCPHPVYENNHPLCAAMYMISTEGLRLLQYFVFRYIGKVIVYTTALQGLAYLHERNKMHRDIKVMMYKCVRILNRCTIYNTVFFHFTLLMYCHHHYYILFIFCIIVYVHAKYILW